VTFEGVDGETLVGTLRECDESAADANAAKTNAATPRQRRPVVLLAHGYMSSRDASVLTRVADALAEQRGVDSLRWDFSGNGESEGRFRYGGYGREAGEIEAATRYCAGEKGYRVTALVGHSKGATSSILYAGGGAGAVPRGGGLRVVNVAGRFDVSAGVERRLGAAALEALRRDGRVERMPGRRSSGGVGGPSSPLFEWTLYREDLEDRLSTDVGAYCAAIAAAAAGSDSSNNSGGSSSSAAAPRVLTLHCADDSEVPAAEAMKFHDALGGDALGHRLVVLEGGDHSFRGAEASARLVEEVVAWCCGGGA
jgi:uncharacterized protein